MIRSLCMVTAFDSPTVREYFLRIVKSIALEFLEYAITARHRICTWPCEQLVHEELCVVNVKFEPYQRKGGKNSKLAELVVIPGDQLGVVSTSQVTDETRGIRAGDVVSILPYKGPKPMASEGLDSVMLEAVVTNNNPIVLRLQDKKASLELRASLISEGNLFRIDKMANRTAFQRQLAAVVVMAGPTEASAPPSSPSKNTKKDPRRPCPRLVKAISVFDKHTAALCNQAVPWRKEDKEEAEENQSSIRKAAKMAVQKCKTLQGLNELQKRAVECSTSNQLTLVQGGPDSGKAAVVQYTR